MSSSGEQTTIETALGNLVVVSLGEGSVVVEWHGPRRAELSPGEARALGYVLRGYARMAEPTGDPGE